MSAASSFKTLAGVLSATAALIGAIVSLYTLWHPTTSRSPGDHTGSTVVVPPSPPPFPESELYGNWQYRDDGVGQMNGWYLVLSRNSTCQLYGGFAILPGSWRFDPTARSMELDFQNPSGAIDCRLTAEGERHDTFSGTCSGNVLGYMGSFQLQLIKTT